MSALDPFYHAKNFMQFLHLVTAGGVPVPEAHPNLPKDDPLWGLMRQCWNSKPGERPQSADVADEVELPCAAVVANLTLFDQLNVRAESTKQPGLTDRVGAMLTRLANSPANSTPASPVDEVELDVDLSTELVGELVPDDHSLRSLGGFADVVKGVWRRDGHTDVVVALKYLRGVGLSTSRTDTDRMLRMDKV